MLICRGKCQGLGSDSVKCVFLSTICGISLIVYRGDLYHKALAIYDKRSVTLHPKTNIYIYNQVQDNHSATSPDGGRVATQKYTVSP